MTEAGNSWKVRPRPPAVFCRDLNAQILVSECLDHQGMCKSHFERNYKMKRDDPFRLSTRCWECPEWNQHT